MIALFLIPCWNYLSYLRFFLKRSYKYSIIWSANRDNLTSSFLISIPLISFSCPFCCNVSNIYTEKECREWAATNCLSVCLSDCSSVCLSLRDDDVWFPSLTVVLSISLFYLALMCWVTFLLFLASLGLLSWRNVRHY